MALKRFGDLEPGDRLIGTNGTTQVVTAYEEHIPESMWEIELEDNSLIKVSGNHLWYCETKLDWELHALRKKQGKKLLKNVFTDKVVRFLEDTAAKDEQVETGLADIILLLRAADNHELVNAVVRIADAIGHVAEETVTMEDIGGREVEEQTIRKYDARLFAQQLLSLSGRRRYRNYKLIVGSVMTTDQMMDLSDTIEIPVTTMLNG